jgi:lysophospholipase L1-like esterase
MEKKIILFFGDSIMVGQGQSIYDGWIVKFAKYIETKNDKYFVINSSVNGRTSRQAVDDMYYACGNNKIEVMIIQFGLNDCNHWDSDHGLPRVSQAAFEANILEMAEKAKKVGVKNIIINNNHPTNVGILKKFNINFDEWAIKYNESLRNIKQQDNIRFYFNDIELKIVSYLKKNNLQKKEILKEDGLHLNNLGHEIYFDIQKEVLKKFIK